MTEQGLAIREADAIQTWSPRQVIAQVQLIQEVMAAVMKKDEHYGIIPGTQKPTLLKPGAEKLCLTFRMAPKYDVIERDLGNGHREYRIVCTLSSIQSGAFLGDGLGICSTMESKYRYRHGEPEDTGVPVPGKYWDAKKSGKMDEALGILGGKGFLAKKNASNQWTIHKAGAGRVENPDIADVYNTVLKMAKKRAHVDATITATGASDIFTQDLEDVQEPEKPAATTASQKEEPTPPGETGGAPPAGGPLSDTDALYVKISELMEGAGWTVAKLTAYVAKTYQGSQGDLTKLSQANLEALAMYLSTEQRQRPLV